VGPDEPQPLAKLGEIALAIKRVASAVGEGSVAIRLIHEYLSHH
jgi:hypothetical protein